jgi:hypothetical protein
VGWAGRRWLVTVKEPLNGAADVVAFHAARHGRSLVA